MLVPDINLWDSGEGAFPFPQSELLVGLGHGRVGQGTPGSGPPPGHPLWAGLLVAEGTYGRQTLLSLM